MYVWRECHVQNIKEQQCTCHALLVVGPGLLPLCMDLDCCLHLCCSNSADLHGGGCKVVGESQSVTSRALKHRNERVVVPDNEERSCGPLFSLED